MSDLVLTPEEMVAELQYRSEIIKELVETNGGLRDENEKLRSDLEDTKSLLPNKPISFLRPAKNHDWWCLSILERRKRVAAEKENYKLREALKALAEHCNNMEAQNQDYHTMGEGGSPCLSEPLANAYAIMRESGDAFEDCRGIAPDATGEMSSEEFIRKERDEW